MLLVDIPTAILSRLLDIFLFGPMENLDVLYILVPVYINWFVNDYYQERKGTSMGNAAANGFTAIWVGIDWVRTMTTRAATSAVHIPMGFNKAFFLLAFKVAIAIVIIGYGLIIMKYAISGNPLAKRIGRIREVSYFAMVFTPVIYLLVPLDLTTFATILIFFPVFYYAGEALMRSLPAPKTELMDEGREEEPRPQPPAQRRPIQPPQTRPIQPPQQRPPAQQPPNSSQQPQQRPPSQQTYQNR
jgi:hypothetical protein